MFYLDYEMPQSFRHPLFVISDSEMKAQKKPHLEAKKSSLQASIDHLQNKMSTVEKSLEKLDEEK